MQRSKIAGLIVVGASIASSPAYVLQLLMSAAMLLNEQSWIMMLGTLSLLFMRLTGTMGAVWVGVVTRFKNMHLFYGGIGSVLFSVIVLSFLPGTFIVTTILALFSSGSLTGFQILQGAVFVVGVMLVIFDFPFGAVKGMRGRSR